MSAAPIRQNTPEWLEARRKGIGGSDAPSVVGLSPFTSALELYHQKRGEAPEREETEAQRWGRILEPAIAEEYARRSGVEIERAVPLRFSHEEPIMIVSLDGIVRCPTRGEGGYEGKSLSAFTRLDDGLPEYIWIQVQHAMAVTGYQWFDIAMLLGGQRFETRTVERDEEAIEMLIDAEREFWRRVQTGSPPPPDGMAATGALLRRMYPEGNGRTIILDDPAKAALARQIDELGVEVRRLEQARKTYIQTFQQILGKNEIAVLPGYGRVTWKTVRADDEIVIDTERLQLDEPEIYARFATTRPKRATRRFLTRPLKRSGEEEEENTQEQ